MKVIAINYSTARVVATCSTRTVLTLLGKDELQPNGALQVGTMFHHAVERHLRGNSADDIRRCFEEEYRGFADGDAKHWLFSADHVGPFDGKPGPDAKPQYHLSNLTAILTQWLARHPQPEPFPNLVVDPNLVEITFAHPLDTIKVNGETYLVVIVGTLDAIGEQGGDLYTIETKTVGKIASWWKDGFEGDHQNSEYEWAAEVSTGREVLGTFINAIGTAKLPTSDRTCYTHHYADLPDHNPRNPHSKDRPMYSECYPLHAETDFFLVSRNSQMLVQWKKDMLWAARRMAELDKFVKGGIVGATKVRTQGRFNGGCTFCAYRRWCIRSAKNPAMADAMMGSGGSGGGREYTPGIYENEEVFSETYARSE